MSCVVGRRLQGLGLRDWLALVVVGPLLGWWLMAGVVGGENRFVASHGWAVLRVGVGLIGAFLGVISPRLRGFAASQ